MDPSARSGRADGLVGLAEAGERKRLAFGDWLISSRNQLDPVLFS
jgi:hypothetical protein